MTNTFQPTRYLALLLLVAGALFEVALAAEVSTRISSRFLARGERALLEVSVIGPRPAEAPDIAPIEGVTIQSTGRGPQSQLIPGRRIEHIFSYIISSYEVGDHRVESVRVKIDNDSFFTEPLDFSVFNPDDLTWGKAKAGDVEFRYASAFKVLHNEPYVNQAVPVEIKLFVPRDLFVIDWGIPDFARDGLTAWRMQPKDMRSDINLLGMPYISVAYPSTLTPTRSGEVTIGPASVRLISTQVVMDGILKRQAFESHVKVPELTLKTRDLPPNAPTGFQNAVGQFKIQLTTQNTEVREGDPIPVDIAVTGSGNLDTLRAPQPVSPLGWKVYEPSRQQRGDERRELSGSVAFQQFLRPLELKSSIPAYRLVFFNPETGKYDSVQTEPIALQMTPAPAAALIAPGPPPKKGMPIEQMTDILGLIPNTALTRKPGVILSLSWLHIFGATICLVLILKIIWLHLVPRLQSDPRRRELLRELREIETHRNDDHRFLMAAGRFIERWLGDQPPAEVKAILDERDANCFRGEDSGPVKIDSGRRKDILSTLRRSATSCLLLATCLIMASGSLQAQDADASAREAYASGRYDRAIETWLEGASYEDLSADTLYHVGNACYRAGSPGYAALYYRRALARDSGHVEARQNLRFLERQYGVLRIDRPDHQYLLARVPLELWQSITWGGIWLCAIGILCFPATRRGAQLRYIAITSLILSPLLAVGGGLGWRYYPGDAAFAPIAKQAVIVNPESKLHSEATRNSSIVIDAPAGSLCEVIHEAGEWSYVSFATKTRGWLPSSHIERITPKEKPEIPKITKPVADETSA